MEARDGAAAGVEVLDVRGGQPARQAPVPDLSDDGRPRIAPATPAAATPAGCAAARATPSALRAVPTDTVRFATATGAVAAPSRRLAAPGCGDSCAAAATAALRWPSATTPRRLSTAPAGLVSGRAAATPEAENVARGTDPAAAKDRDAANTALLTNSDLGGTFHETAHRSFARSRAGIRVEDAIAECGAADNVFEKDGQAVVDSILQSQNGVSAQVIAEEVLIVGSPPSATPVLDAIVGTLRSCVRAGLAKSQSTVGIQLQLSPSPAPDIGDRAAAFAGSAGFGGGSAAIGILIVQQGRAIAFLMAFDSTGNLQGARLESSMHTLLGRLAPTFGP